MAFSQELLNNYRAMVARRAASFATDGVSALDTIERAAPKFAGLTHIFQQLQLDLEQFNFIHVTGTSGKGSVVKLIHDILVADGQRVGSLVTPYTTTFLESFLVNNGLVDPATLVESANLVLDSIEGQDLPAATNLPIALEIFRRRHLNWAVIEVGRGGRFDATNIIPSPKIAIITNVDFDHQATLGPTLNDIAWQKAGIIKAGCHVICGETRPELRAIFEHEAQQVGATIEFVPWHQDYLEHNKAIARAAARYLGIDSRTSERAITHSKTLPCRFELIQQQPIIILDGAHNPAKITATANRLKTLNSRGTSEGVEGLTILFGCKSSKDAYELLKPLIPLAHTIHTTRYLAGAGKASDPHELLDLIPTSKRGVAYDSPHVALETVRASLSPADTLLITGSLYLAGELRTHWVTEEDILQHQGS